MPLHWTDRLEQRFGSWAVPNLSLLIVALNASIYALSALKPEFPLALTLEPALLMRGEVWRAFTFLFIPPAAGPLAMFFWLYLLYLYARALEEVWGEFRFNLFYAVGAAATVAAALAMGRGLSNVPLNASLFLAFSAVNPDLSILLFFILPVKVRWLAALVWAGIAWSLLVGSWPTRVALLAGLANYALFFGPRLLAVLRGRLR